MTDYWLGDREELTPEEKKRSEVKFAKIREATKFAEPLLKEIAIFVGEAKNGKVSRKRQYELFKKLKKYKALCKKVGGGFQLSYFDGYQKTIEVLGAYEYARLMREGK